MPPKRRYKRPSKAPSYEGVHFCANVAPEDVVNNAHSVTHFQPNSAAQAAEVARKCVAKGFIPYVVSYPDGGAAIYLTQGK